MATEYVTDGYPRIPTADECNKNSEIEWSIGGRKVYAIAAWYPQMGGYCAKCVISSEGC